MLRLLGNAMKSSPLASENGDQQCLQLKSQCAMIKGQRSKIKNIRMSIATGTEQKRKSIKSTESKAYCVYSVTTGSSAYPCLRLLRNAQDIHLDSGECGEFLERSTFPGSIKFHLPFWTKTKQ